MKWHEAPLLPVAAVFAAGIFSATWLTMPTWWILVGGTLLLVVAAALLARGWEHCASAGLFALALVLGALRGESDPVPADHIARLALGSLASVEGRLVAAPGRLA